MNKLFFTQISFPWGPFNNYLDEMGGGHCALNRFLSGHSLGIKMLNYSRVETIRGNTVCQILVVFEVPAQPKVKGMSGNS